MESEIETKGEMDHARLIKVGDVWHACAPMEKGSPHRSFLMQRANVVEVLPKLDP